MGKTRFQIFLDDEQKRSLEMLQRDTKTSMVEIIRDAINRKILEYKKKITLPGDDKTTGNLLALARVCEGGPHDLADSKTTLKH